MYYQVVGESRSAGHTRYHIYVVCGAPRRMRCTHLVERCAQRVGTGGPASDPGAVGRCGPVAVRPPGRGRRGGRAGAKIGLMRLRAAALSRRAYEAATAGRWLCPCGRGRRSRFSSHSFYRIANAIELPSRCRAGGGSAVGRAVYTAIIIVESPSLWLLTKSNRRLSRYSLHRDTHAFLRVGA